jgi:hypothetical protein
MRFRLPTVTLWLVWRGVSQRRNRREHCHLWLERAGTGRYTPLSRRCRKAVCYWQVGYMDARSWPAKYIIREDKPPRRAIQSRICWG